MNLIDTKQAGFRSFLPIIMEQCLEFIYLLIFINYENAIDQLLECSSQESHFRKANSDKWYGGGIIKAIYSYMGAKCYVRGINEKFKVQCEVRLGCILSVIYKKRG